MDFVMPNPTPPQKMENQLSQIVNNASRDGEKAELVDRDGE